MHASWIGIYGAWFPLVSLLLRISVGYSYSLYPPFSLYPTNSFHVLPRSSKTSAFSLAPNETLGQRRPHATTVLRIWFLISQEKVLPFNKLELSFLLVFNSSSSTSTIPLDKATPVQLYLAYFDQFTKQGAPKIYPDGFLIQAGSRTNIHLCLDLFHLQFLLSRCSHPQLSRASPALPFYLRSYA